MDARNLPGFDNHYGNGTLIENWHEDRLYQAQVSNGDDARRHELTLSGASPQQAVRDVAEWNATVSTYTDAYGRTTGTGPDGDAPAESGKAADMCRPQELQRELLLGSGDITAKHTTGDPMSSEWGAFWSGSAGPSATGSGRVANNTVGEGGAQANLLSSSAAARQQANVRNLYESNHQQASHRGGPLTFTGAGCPALFKTLDNTEGRVRTMDTATNRPGDLEPDEAVADRFATTKTSADAPVSHFYFQRKLPPPTQ